MTGHVLNFAHVATHKLYCGMTGMGKSTLVRAVVAKDKAPWKFAFETYKKEFPRFCGWPLANDEPGLVAGIQTGRVAFNSAPLFPGNRVAGFNFWIRWVYNVGRVLPGRKLVIIEEIEKTTAHRNSTPAPAFMEMLDEGRAAQFDVISIAQRLSTVNELVRTTITEITAFQFVDPGQVSWLEEEGFNGDAIKRLGRGNYIHRHRERGTEATNAPSPKAKLHATGKRDRLAPAKR